MPLFRGRFGELAHGGALFLDESRKSDMASRAQVNADDGLALIL